MGSTSPRPNKLALLAVLGFMLALTVVCAWYFGHSETAPANGLVAAQLEEALPDDAIWSTHRWEQQTHRDRVLSEGVNVGVVLDDDQAQVSVFANAGRTPRDDAESAAWRSEVDEIIARIEAVHPDVGPWEHSDNTADTLWMWFLGVLVVGVALLWIVVRVLVGMTRPRETPAAAKQQQGSGPPR